MSISDSVTVCITTSPIPRHPSTDMIERVINSVRFHLPTAKIMVLFDGVRPNVEFRRWHYVGYMQHLKQMIDSGQFGNAGWMDHVEYTQQAQMMKNAIGVNVTTPLILFCGHDEELVTTHNPRDGYKETLPEDCIIQWGSLADTLLAGDLNMIRFYAWEKIWPEHQHLMHGEFESHGARYVRTTQYSQWPNLATTEFYKHILNTYFVLGERKMIELGMYGPVVSSPWEKFKIGIYYPGENNRRMYHLNGRADETGKQDPVDW